MYGGPTSSKARGASTGYYRWLLLSPPRRAPLGGPIGIFFPKEAKSFNP